MIKSLLINKSWYIQTNVIPFTFGGAVQENIIMAMVTRTIINGPPSPILSISAT